MTLLPASGMSHLQTFAEQQISSASNDLGHEKNSGEKVGLGGSFLTRLLKMQYDNPAKMSNADIFTTCITNIGAGSDTTSVSLTSVMYHLMKNPSKYAKVSTREYYPFHKCLLAKRVLRERKTSSMQKSTKQTRRESFPYLISHSKSHRSCHTCRHVSKRLSVCTRLRACRWPELSLQVVLHYVESSSQLGYVNRTSSVVFHILGVQKVNHYMSCLP